MFANYYGEIRGGRSFAGAQGDKEDWLRMAKGFPVEPGMTETRAGIAGESKGNDGEGEHWKRWGEASWKDKGENSGKDRDSRSSRE